mmetsp:Transcript_59922/g.106593  ORF Transcript_59922/g.106593 Transcript_59922/m.106593 type:complete len:241 (+) Transcript_59922:82-804(+)|eukprot:CAMPEP_0197650876 /NCGR_PEP_ID=MMETSP1338-20131121/31209_1 /TAXON_ID=43686 ORGANISM="Pelagodinium beii, Strain RCC1491" /NCGR_SAMPLE_ID=MMETSP1338 /ASSEMBLY_ACC=CAM_ASM_000754 /LENGTH=240 /DNA_ID=CAMNT_0043225373 /DNA_START=57 /DNA_END=779 /DNA_ORIENTATION=+
MGEFGFAMDAYVVPKNGLDPTTVGGTMAKASNEVGSVFSKAKKTSPGPDTYHKDILTRKTDKKAPGGPFSKLSRDGVKHKVVAPAVGQYQSHSALSTPRTRGGIMPKTPRGCLFYDQAVTESKWKPAPGKYEPKPPEKHTECPMMTVETSASRMPKKPNALGPGYYSLNYQHTEKKPLAYSGTKEENRNYLDKKLSKDKTPGPGVNGIPDPKVHDRDGRRKHCAKLLADKIITPRMRQTV